MPFPVLYYNSLIAHVNKGRYGEFFVLWVTVFLEKSDNPSRNTKYDLVKVVKGEFTCHRNMFENKQTGWLKMVVSGII